MEDLTRVLLIDAHARAQRKDWDGAADNLLGIYKIGFNLPREAPMVAVERSVAIRRLAFRDFSELYTHLSASKAREAARKIENLLSTSPTIAQSLQWEKRDSQLILLHLIKQHDLTSLYFYDDCIDLKYDRCGLSKDDYAAKSSALSAQLKFKLRWLNKPHLMEETNRCLDWQIAQAAKPWPSRSKKWPFAYKLVNGEVDGVEAELYPRFESGPSHEIVCKTEDTLLATSMALRAYRMDKGAYPTDLKQLSPVYLARTPVDPFTLGQALLYKPKPISYIVSNDEEQIRVVAPKFLPLPTPTLGMPPPSASWTPILPSVPRQSPLAVWRTVTQRRSIPFTLYSVGPDGADDKAKPYVDQSSDSSRP